MLPINTYTKITARKNSNIALYGSAQLNLEMFLFQFINENLFWGRYIYKISINNNDTVF